MVDIQKPKQNAAPSPSAAGLVDDDVELQLELKTHVEQLLKNDERTMPHSLHVLKHLIRTSTTSMTSVPKPLKYLGPYYNDLKTLYEGMRESMLRKSLADIISVLAMCPLEKRAETELDCLKYCMVGTLLDIGGWGHEYVHHLENQIIEQVLQTQLSEDLMIDLIHDCLAFDCAHHGEIQACDFLMEIDRLDLLAKYLDVSVYKRVCLYLTSCARYVDEVEHEKIYRVVSEQYLLHHEWIRALVIAIHTKNDEMVNVVFNSCQDKLCMKQLAFIAARQLQNVVLNVNLPNRDEVINILNNTYLSQLFMTLGRELDIMEPKSPDDVYKTWLDGSNLRQSILGDNVDSARQNLASTFVNAFINAAFGLDNLVTGEPGNRWIYRNKENGMLSATASLGMIHLWDVDGGLTPIDKYLYSGDEVVKAGALLALGIVNCRVRNECDPALALLVDFLFTPSGPIKDASLLGLGLAYIGTNRPDIAVLLIAVLDETSDPESFAIACLAAGMISFGTCEEEISKGILLKILDKHNEEMIKSVFMPLAILGLGLLFLGRKEAIDPVCEAFEVIPEPMHSIFKSIMQLCGYAGTGDVFMIQKMLGQISDRVAACRDDENKAAGDDKTKKEKAGRKKDEVDPSLARAIPVLGLGCVSLAEETGAEMCSKVLSNVGRYGDAAVRRAVPLAVAMNSVSRPNLSVIEVLTKFSHDSDDKVACNALFAMGIVGAGTNNARLAAGLRQLANYHARNAPELFMVRLAQGLTHMGKGTLTLSPLHNDMQLIDYGAVAGLLVPLVSLLDPHAFILGKHHFFLFTLAAAMQPRWLITVDENLQSQSIPVHVGTAIDIVGKAGTPKTIAGIHSHTTPVLMAVGERAEMVNDQWDPLPPTLEGICVLRKKPVTDGTIASTSSQ